MEILFVYNADSDPLSVALDFGHKILSPSTYECRLCGLTYGYFSMKSEWRSFVKGLGLPVSFLHKDEALKRYASLSSSSFPAAFVVSSGEPTTFITSEEMDRLEDLKSLETLVRERVATLPR